MKLNQITQIKQTYHQSEVNEFLAKGFELIKIFSSKVKTDNFDEIKPIYILGLEKQETKQEKQ